MIVYKSTADGRSQRVDAAYTEGEGTNTFVFDLSLKPFVDGGWYWYDVVAGDDDAVVESAEWTAEVPDDRAEHGTADIAITTMNRPDFCAKLLGQMGDDEVLAPYLDTVLVMEQGTDKVVDSPEFAKAVQPRSAPSCGSSSRATSAAPAATPAASSSRCARAPRRTR